MIDKAKMELEASFFIKAFGIAGSAICKERNDYIFRQISQLHENQKTEPILSGKLTCSCIDKN
jgi:hypothetical protein